MLPLLRLENFSQKARSHDVQDAHCFDKDKKLNRWSSNKISEEVPLAFKFTVSLLAANFKNSADWANIYTDTKILFPHDCMVGVYKIKNLVIDKESSSTKQIYFLFDFSSTRKHIGTLKKSVQ